MPDNRQPKISIITPSYNQGHFIEETILSVLEQGYPNLEYIIIDGGSSDNTAEIIRKYEKYLHFWVSEKDKGQSDAINKGMSYVTGDIVNWLNSDDYYMPGALQHVAGHFNDRDVTVYCGRSRIFSDTYEKYSQGTDVYKGNLAKTIGWARIDQPETFFRKSIWDSIGLLNESFHYVMDREWWIRYLFAFGLDGIVKDDQVIVNFRIHGNSKTGSQLEKFRKEALELYHALSAMDQTFTGLRFFSEVNAGKKKLFGYDNIDRELLKAGINYYFLFVLLEAYAMNDYQLARRVLPYIQLQELQESDRQTIQSVLLRMRLIPAPLKKWYNRISDKLRG